MSLLFAATYPERVRGLVLYGSMVCGHLDPDDNPGGPRWMDAVARLKTAVENWGKGLLIDAFSPTLAGQPFARRLAGIHERAMASPAMAKAAYHAVLGTDVRDVLHTIQTPTLILHRIGDVVPIEGARYMAEHIDGARLVELPGADHYWWVGDAESILEELEEFVTGTRPERHVDRMLATLLFTDIVRSTERVTDLGDSAWRGLLERHNEATRAALAAFQGREVNSTGDGFLAAFDGPARGVRCAQAIVESVRRLGLEVRAGLHAGECELLGDDLGGIAVHIGARVSSVAAPGEVLVSGTVRDLVAGSGIEFVDAGRRELKGVPGAWLLYRVVSVPTEDGGAREPLPEGAAPLVHESPPLSHRAMMAAVRRAPGLSRRAGARMYRRAAVGHGERSRGSV
jgi:class 3 adenylate cyclase